MQIRASRRQTSAQTGRRPHKVLARHWALQRRLVTGGVLALAVSVLAWLLGAPLPMHLGLTLVGFGVGFFWRFTAVGRRAERWAFSWIEERAGLSYLTAYELPQADAEVNSETDPAAGFGEAVRARAAQVGRLETPSLQPWALPLIVLALALAALPHLVLPTWRAPLAPLTERLPFPTPQTDLPAPEDALAAAPKPRTGTTPSAPETGTETGQESTDTPGDSGTDSSDTGASFNDAAAPSEGGAATGERAALENFLEQSGAAQTGASQANQEGVPQRGLPQANPPQTAASPIETAQTDASQTDASQTDTSQAGTSQSAPQGGGGDQAQSGQRPAETGSAQPRASNTSGDTPNNRGGATAPGEGSPVGREAKAKSDVGQNPEQNSGQNAGQEGAAQAETPGSADESAQESSSQSAQPPQAQANSPQSGSQQASQAGADAAQNSSASSQGSNAQRSAAPDAGNQASGDATNGASSNRAGTRAGGDIASSRERLGNASPQTPERVTGSRQDGPLSFAGETLRQGDAPDALPQNGSAAYRRAAEEVIREGRIPLEYQEIVRDYFR